jgi:hypothetical protein
MGSGLQIRGVVGQVKWSYYIAAGIHGYTVQRDQAGAWSLRGAVVVSDAFKLSQRPLVFVAPHAKGEWRWPIIGLEIQGGSLTAALGPLETK